jgi:hypothetical protein
VNQTKLSTVLLTVTAIAMLAASATPAQAGIIGDVPVIPFERDPYDYNLLVGVDIDNLWITKGVVQAAEHDRFIMVTSIEFTRKDGSWIAGIDPKDQSVTKDEDAELRKGAYVKAVPILRLVPSTVGETIRPYITDGKSVLCEVTIQLMLVDGKGGRHILETVVATEVLKGGPAPVPQG